MISKRMILVSSLFLFLLTFINQSLSQELSTDVLLEKAKIQFIFKNYDRALELAQTVVNSDENNMEAYLIIAQVYYINGKFKEAKETFDKILSFDPSLKKEFVRDYGIVLKAYGEYIEALKCLEEFLKDNSEDSLALYHKSDIFLLNGEYDKAERIIGEVLKKRDDLYIPSAIMLSEIYIKKGKTREAEEILKSLEAERLSDISTQIINGLIGRVTTRKEYYRKLSVEFSLGAGYDSNGIYLTDSEVELDTQKDSFFSELYADISYNPIINPKRRLYLRLYLSKSFYFEDESKQFDRLLLNPRIGYKFYTEENRTTLLDFGYEYNNNFFSGGNRVGFKDFGSYYQKNALYAELNHKFGKTGGLVRYEFGFAEFYDHNKSGFEHRLMLISNVPIRTGGTFYIGPTISLDDIRLNLYDYFSIGATAGFQLRIIKDLSMAFATSYEHRDYFDNSEERNDDILYFSSRIEYQLPLGIYVAGIVGYSVVDSSLKRYGFDKWFTLLNVGFNY